jgi:hypothetical protein
METRSRKRSAAGGGGDAREPIHPQPSKRERRLTAVDVLRDELTSRILPNARKVGGLGGDVAAKATSLYLTAEIDFVLLKADLFPTAESRGQALLHLCGLFFRDYTTASWLPSSPHLSSLPPSDLVALASSWLLGVGDKARRRAAHLWTQPAAAALWTVVLVKLSRTEEWFEILAVVGVIIRQTLSNEARVGQLQRTFAAAVFNSLYPDISDPFSIAQVKASWHVTHDAREDTDVEKEYWNLIDEPTRLWLRMDALGVVDNCKEVTAMAIARAECDADNIETLGQGCLEAFMHQTALLWSNHAELVNYGVCILSEMLSHRVGQWLRSRLAELEDAAGTIPDGAFSLARAGDDGPFRWRRAIPPGILRQAWERSPALLESATAILRRLEAIGQTLAGHFAQAHVVASAMSVELCDTFHKAMVSTARVRRFVQLAILFSDCVDVLHCEPLRARLRRFWHQSPVLQACVRFAARGFEVDPHLAVPAALQAWVATVQQASYSGGGRHPTMDTRDRLPTAGEVDSDEDDVEMQPAIVHPSAAVLDATEQVHLRSKRQHPYFWTVPARLDADLISSALAAKLCHTFPDPRQMWIRLRGHRAEGLGVHKEWLARVTEQLFAPSTGVWELNRDTGYYQFAREPRVDRASRSVEGVAYITGAMVALHVYWRIKFPYPVLPALFHDVEGVACLPLESLQAHAAAVDPVVARTIGDVLNDGSDTTGHVLTCCDRCEDNGRADPCCRSDGGAILLEGTRVSTDVRRLYVCNELDRYLRKCVAVDWARSFLGGVHFYDSGSEAIAMLATQMPADFAAFVYVSPAPVCIDAWRRVTSYGTGLAVDAPIVVQFWDVVEKELDDAERRALLLYVTGSKHVGVSFHIARSTEQRNQAHFLLPTSHSCFNTLFLPSYPSREALAQALKRAIELTPVAGFGLQ